MKLTTSPISTGRSVLTSSRFGRHRKHRGDRTSSDLPRRLDVRDRQNRHERVLDGVLCNQRKAEVPSKGGRHCELPARRRTGHDDEYPSHRHMAALSDTDRHPGLEDTRWRRPTWMFGVTAGRQLRRSGGPPVRIAPQARQQPGLSVSVARCADRRTEHARAGKRIGIVGQSLEEMGAKVLIESVVCTDRTSEVPGVHEDVLRECGQQRTSFKLRGCILADRRNVDRSIEQARTRQQRLESVDHGGRNHPKSARRQARG